MLKVPNLPCTLSQSNFLSHLLVLGVALLSVLRTLGMAVTYPPCHVNFILCVNSATSFTVVSQGSVKSSQALKRLLKLERTRFCPGIYQSSKNNSRPVTSKAKFQKMHPCKFSGFQQVQKTKL